MEGNVLLSFVLPSNFRINTERIIIQCYKFSFDKMLIEIHECKKRVLSLMLLSNMIKLKIEPSLRNHIHHSFTSEKSGKRLSKKILQNEYLEKRRKPVQRCDAEYWSRITWRVLVLQYTAVRFLREWCKLADWPGPAQKQYSLETRHLLFYRQDITLGITST